MTVWTPALWSPGDTFTYEQANTLLSGPYYHLTASSGQTIDNDSATAFDYDSVVEHNSRYTAVSTPASGVTVPITGLYLIEATVTFTANATGHREAYISVGGSTLGGTSTYAPSSTRAWVGQISATKRLSAATAIAVYAYQDSTASLDTSESAMGGCRLTVTWLGLR